MRKNMTFKRILSVLLCLALVLPYLPSGILRGAAAEQTLNIVSGSKKADPSTINWEQYFGPDKMDTEFAGGVWTDKSVFTGATDELPGVSLKDQNNFLVALSAIASNLSITGYTSAPTDTMLVLDLSGSMADDTYEVGVVRQNYNYQTVNGIDMSLVNAMIEATNATIDKLMRQNSNNRVGVVLYSGNAATNEAATPGTATVVLPLDRYAGIDGEYLSVDTTWQERALYRYVYGWGGGWKATGETARYVAEGTAVNVSVKDGLKTEDGTDVRDSSKQTIGGTYLQNGMYQAMGQFLNVTDTVVPEGRPQAGAERMPVLVLMTDGAPTIATTSYTNIGDSNTGDGTTTTDRITFLTQLTAAYVRGRVASHYQENENDQKDILFLTLGLGTENSSAATNTLYPAGSNADLVTYWNRYLAAAAGQNVTAITGDDPLTVRREADVEAMNYVDTYYYASNAQGLIDSFAEIVNEIELKSESYATLVEGGNADFSGYITFDDQLGEMMQVVDMKGVRMSDGKGNTVLYTGKGLAEGMTNGNLGTVDQPTARGDELVRTIKERIPGITTTQAQQLVGYAYADNQLYYEDAENWSNYIGWYADADGNYVGFWDKDSGYENAPEGAVYANRSYGYLGVNGDSDMMHVVVLVRTDLTALNQTVFFKIPGSLLPTVQYKVTLDEDDPTVVEEFIREDAAPMQLVFEVGLRSDINAVNMEQKIAEHIAKGGHVHRNADGTVTFYTNGWQIGNDANGNGIPDADELSSAVVAESHFQPALDNSRYYYTEDTLIYDGNGNFATGASRPEGQYYHYRNIYDQQKLKRVRMPVAADTLANQASYDADNNRWYIPAGTIFQEVERFVNSKTENVTGTLSYSDFPAVFENDGKQDVYAFLGNNGSITVAPATGITLRKQVQGTIEDVSSYTFRVSLSDIPVGTTAAPVLTDANGDTLSGVSMSDYADGRFTVTMPADVTAYISGIPVGTTVRIEEQIDGDYKVVDIQVAGQKQTVGGSATATVPAYAEGVSQMVPVVITNAPNSYGNLVISKDIIHNLASDPDAMADKEFSFRVKLTGSKIAAGDTFQTSENAAVTVDSEGYLTYPNGELIKLKNEESVTIYRIPEGTSYVVTEDSLPGFKLDNINGETGETQASGVIIADGESLESFYNRYPDHFETVEVPVEVDVTKILNQISPYTGSEEFVFVLQQLLDDGTYPSIEDVNGNAYLKVGADRTEQAAFKLSFDDLGTYFFRVVELKPSEQEPKGTDTPGMNYSTMRALFQVNVTDQDMDGELEIAVRAEANVTVTPQYTGDDTERIEKISVAAAFTNNYQVNSANTSLNVHKNLNNNTGALMALTDFRFTMYPCDANGNVAEGATGTQVTTSALGDATFNIFLDTAGTYCYVVSENIPAEAVLDAETGKYFLNGMSYDSAQYLYTVVAQVNSDSDLVVTSRTLVNLTTNETVDPADGIYTAQFTNDYELTSVDVMLPFSKKLTGRMPKDGEIFKTFLVRTDGSFNALTDSDAWTASYFIDANYKSNVRLTFDKVGTYHYKWTEVAPEGATLDPVTGKYVLDGTYYDNAQYHITITVADNGTGGLTAQTVIHKLGTAAAVTSVDFVNTYIVSGSGDVTIGGKKVLDGRAMVAGEFTIGLYSDADCKNLIETTANRADGSFNFSTITYTAADLGENHAEKTYTYYVKEVPGDKGGVTYDPNVYTVTVKVGHENGNLTVTPSGNAVTLQITNKYVADGVDAVLSGSKVLSGDWSNVANQNFTFQLFQADSNFVITNQSPIRSETVTGNADFSMTLSYEDGQEGKYCFVMKEDASAQAGGVGYDAGEYHITVNVSDPGDGKLVATVTMYRPGMGNTTTARFTNNYSVESTTITLEGDKSYVNSVTNEPLAMTEGMFSFVVLEGENPVATGYNLADGTIQFTPIRYTTAGVHTYSVVELESDAGGITYDDAVFTVVVTVADNGDGTLTATADYGNKPVAFLNTYTHESAQVTLNGTKVLTGDWSAVQDVNKIFTFELYETGADFVIGGEPLDITTNELAGGFTFGTLTYTAEGTRYYVIVERSGDPDKGITYDDTQIQITVEVEDDGDGKLIPTVTVSDSNITITENSNLVAVDGITFTNGYQAKPAQYIPVAQKLYEGDEMKEFNFVLTVDGNNEQIKQNDSDGKIVFDTLTFNTAGIYELKIREQENLEWSSIRWDKNVYTVTLHVEDNGKGQLFVNESKTAIVSENGRVDLVFRNAHHDVITEKDVFLPGDTTVSIDGMTVEKGDILQYHISFTNFDNVPVDITITDVIPQYTTYVNGSADNGGVLSGSTLTWTLEDVEADATVTVRFQVKVAEANITVTNGAAVLEGQNTYETNIVTNPVEEDKVEKDVFLPSEPTVSIDGETVEKGEILLYKVTYTNSDEFAADVTITDVIPAHTTYVDGSADNGGVYADGSLTWNVHLDAGDIFTVSFLVKVVDANITVINQATALEGENELQTNAVTNPVTEDKVVKDVFLPDDLSVSIDGKTVELGDVLQYTITYTNKDSFAADVTITDLIPQYTAYVEGSADNGGVYADGKLTWDVTLEAGESITVSFQVKVTDTKVTINNQATVLEGENGYETNVVTNPVREDKVIKDVFLPSDPTVSIDGKVVEKNDILLYKVTYTNSDDFAANVTITDAIPQYTTYVDGSADNGGIYADGVLTWNMTLAAGESITVSFRVKVIDTNITVNNQAMALEGENQYETNIVSNPVEEDEVIKDVFLPSEPTVSIDGKVVEKNDILLYKITYTNSDDFAADVTITDAIPAHTTYVVGSADNGGIYADGKLTWNVTLDAGESITVSFRVKVADTNITVKNQAVALEGENQYKTNAVINETYTPDPIPVTGDEFEPALWIGVMTVCAMGLFVLVISKKRIVR